MLYMYGILGMLLIFYTAIECHIDIQERKNYAREVFEKEVY